MAWLVVVAVRWIMILVRHGDVSHLMHVAFKHAGLGAGLFYAVFAPWTRLQVRVAIAWASLEMPYSKLFVHTLTNTGCPCTRRTKLSQSKSATSVFTTLRFCLARECSSLCASSEPSSSQRPVLSLSGSTKDDCSNWAFVRCTIGGQRSGSPGSGSITAFHSKGSVAAVPASCSSCQQASAASQQLPVQHSEAQCQRLLARREETCFTVRGLFGPRALLSQWCGFSCGVFIRCSACWSSLTPVLMKP